MPFKNFVDTEAYGHQIKENHVRVVEAWRKSFEGIIMSRSDYDKIKEIMRLGIPDEIRGEIWCEVLQVESVDVFERDYGTKLYKIFGKTVPEKLQPPTFGFWNINQFCTSLFFNNRGKEIFRNVLCIIAYDYPDLHFCPFIPPLVALLLHQMSAYDTLGCIVSLLKRSETKTSHKEMMTSGPVISMKTSPLASPEIGGKLSLEGPLTAMPATVTTFVIDTSDVKNMSHSEGSWGYVPFLQRSFYVFGLVFVELTSKFAKPISKFTRSKLKFSEVEETSIYIRLITKFYVGMIPLGFVYRIIDMYFYEGYKALFRCGLGWLNLIKEDLLKAKSKEDFERIIFLDRSESFKASEFDSWMKSSFSFNLTRNLTENLHLKYLSEKEDSINSLNELLNPGDCTFRPVPNIISGESQFISSDDWYFIWSCIPTRFKLHDLALCFSAKSDGYYLPNLYAACSQKFPLLIIIETFEGAEFGAFINESLGTRDGKKFIGTGETFIFSLRPYSKLYTWNSGSDGNNHFAVAAPNFLAFGAGGDGHGIWINNELTKVSSSHCKTFANDPLTPQKGKEYDISGVEVYHLSVHH